MKNRDSCGGGSILLLLFLKKIALFFSEGNISTIVVQNFSVINICKYMYNYFNFMRMMMRIVTIQR